MKLKNTPKTKGKLSPKKALNDIAKRLKAGAKYEDLLDELDFTLGLDKSQVPSDNLDREWEDNYRKG